MNNQTKILLTITGIEGATLRLTGKKKILFEMTKENMHWQKHQKRYSGEDKDKVVRKGVRKVCAYDVIPCSKGIKLTYDAYNYMTSTERPEWYYKKDWTRLSPITRLELHLQRICDANRGTGFTYSILED